MAPLHQPGQLGKTNSPKEASRCPSTFRRNFRTASLLPLQSVALFNFFHVPDRSFSGRSRAAPAGLCAALPAGRRWSGGAGRPQPGSALSCRLSLAETGSSS